MINYSALPKSTIRSSPWQSLLPSILVFVILLVVLIPIIIVTGNNPASPLRLLPGVFVVISIPIILILVYRRLSGKIQKQRVAMKLFASQNGWSFEGKKTIDSSSLLPPGWNLLTNEAWQIYHINGKVQTRDFDLYTLQGFTRTLFATEYGNSTLAYRTFIKTTAPIDTSVVNNKLEVVRHNECNYVLMNGNAFTASDLQELFKPLVGIS